MDGDPWPMLPTELCPEVARIMYFTNYLSVNYPHHIAQAYSLEILNVWCVIAWAKNIHGVHHITDYLNSALSSSR